MFSKSRGMGLLDPIVGEYLVFSFCPLIFLSFLLFLEGEEAEDEGGGESQAPHRAQCEAQPHHPEIRTRANIKSQMLNLPRQTVPLIFSKYNLWSGYNYYNHFTNDHRNAVDTQAVSDKAKGDAGNFLPKFMPLAHERVVAKQVWRNVQEGGHKRPVNQFV